MITKQIISQVKPAEENQNLGITILCSECNTGRVFKIENTLKLLQNRKSEEFAIDTVCEKCGRKIIIRLGWIDARKIGYSYRYPDKVTYKRQTEVIDENGLSEMHID